MAAGGERAGRGLRNLRLELVEPDRSAWDGSLDGVESDIYHGAAYHRFCQGRDAGCAQLIVVREGPHGLAWPYLLRPIGGTDGLADATGMDVHSVYGYPGPVAWGCVPGDPFLQHAWQQVVEHWRDQGVVTAFTRFHPLLGNAAIAAAFPSGGGASDAPAVRQLGETVSIDLRLSNEDAVAQYHGHTRYEIKRARRMGLVSRVDPAWSSVEAFVALYGDTMQRANAGASYALSAPAVGRLRAELGARIHLIVTEMGDVAAAAGLFTEHRGIVQAHLVGTNDAFRAWSPLKVLLDDVRRWAAERGNHVFHLGGGRGGRPDSLLAFKMRFSTRRHPFHVGGWVIDPDAYRALVASRAAHLAAVGHEVADQDFFPIYRAPSRPIGRGNAP